MNFKPLHDRVAIKLVEEEEKKTAGGIIIPDTAQEKPMCGEVMAVGNGALREDGTLIPMILKVGDKVLFGKWGGNEVKIKGEKVTIMKESDVLGVLK